ncbi:MAG: GNAT family N-acetyltransferase, partial [Candidatus Sulfotelmatobacter sp.]
CNPKIRQFYDEISQVAERFGYLCLYSLELNGELLASHFGLSHRGRYFSPKIAYNEKFPQYAPGHLIVSEIMQDCASRGISEYDITGVNDEWKMKWTTETRAKFKYFVFRSGVAGRLAYTLRFRVRPAVKKLVRR